MNRSDAIKLIIKEIGNEVIISANGFISRDVFNAKDKNTNFYMIGSMGLASSIGLGIALGVVSSLIAIRKYLKI